MPIAVAVVIKQLVLANIQEQAVIMVQAILLEPVSILAVLKSFGLCCFSYYSLLPLVEVQAEVVLLSPPSIQALLEVVENLALQLFLLASYM